MPVLANRTYTALFIESDYSVVVRSADPSKGTVSGGGQNISYGSHVLIAATPYPGYEFTQWDDGNTDNPRSIHITGNYGGNFELVFIASFDVKHLTVTVDFDSTKGAVTGMGVYEYGDTVTLRALAFEGFRFKKWSDDRTENPRVWVITSDLNVTAQFVAGRDGIDEDKMNEAVVFGSEGHVVVESAAPASVAIYDAVGRLIVRDATPIEGRRQYLMPSTGIYVVRVGETPARKVVVKR